MRVSRCESLPAPAPKRGSALILVVAILGLLAVIGTVYIVSARTESASARAGSEGLNLDLAREAVMNQVRTALYSATVNGEGRVGVIESNADLPRFFDYPEHHGGKARDMPDFASLSNNKHELTPDQPWLARTLHRASQTDDDLCDLPNVNDHPADSAIQPFLNVLGDSTSGYVDAVAHLLSYTSPRGERYRFGVRIIDLSRMADLNVGAPFAGSSGASGTDPDGTFLTSYPLADGGVIDTSRHNLYVKPFSIDDWQQQVFQMERPGNGVAFFDVADELELRAENVAGPSAAARPVAVWSSLAANAARHTCWSFSRDLRLRNSPAMTISNGDKLAVVAPPYTLNAANAAVLPLDCGPFVWPLAPAKIGINPRLDASTPGESLFYLAKAATNIATAMETSGFSPKESRAFAVNYLTARWSGMKADGDAYYFPAGPSIIDDKGICVRATDSTGGILKADTSEFGGPSDLSAVFPANYGGKADENGRIYVGFLPQPFINKVAVEVAISGGSPEIDTFAVELYNPFPVRLSLRDFVVQTSRNGPAIPLDSYTVDAHGFLTLLFSAGSGGGTLQSRVSGPAVTLTGGVLDASDGKITLSRKYIPRQQTDLGPTAEVDEYPYKTVAGTNTPSAAGVYLLRRLNQTNGGGPAWESAVASSDATTPYSDNETTPILGVLNPAPPTGPIEKQIVPIDLGDRYTEEAFSTGAAVAGPIGSLRNLNDFNRIPRICNIIQNPAITPSKPIADQTSPLSQQLGDLFASPPTTPTTPVPYTSHTDFPYDAQVHFDFKATPTFFEDPAHLPRDTAPVAYDARALQLFDYLAVLDRVGDPSVDIGGGRNDTAKLRLPGRINVNTADVMTLSAIANMPSGVAAKIIAYRDRTYGSYPGRGIRTLAELLVPIGDALGNSPQNLRQRDDIWARIINQCTTRSDSFAVYGYLEAIRPNPNVATHTADDLYDVASTSGDPHDATAKTIRIAARRWVAIVDRSWCNAMRGEAVFELPRVEGIRDR